MTHAAFDAIARLREFVAQEHPLDSPAAWIADRLREYLDHAPEGLKVDAALGVAAEPGRDPWWVQEERDARDAALRRLADPFFGEPLAEQARRIARAVATYRAARWRIDVALGIPPPGPRRDLYAVVAGGGGAVPGERTIRRVLAAGHEIRDFMANDPWSTGNDGGPKSCRR